MVFSADLFGGPIIVYAARASKKANGRYLETVRGTGI